MKRTAIVIGISVVASLVALPGHATPVARVNGTGTVYTTLQAAIGAAHAGDRVQCSTAVGAYNETVVIGKNLMLDGGYDLPCTNKLGSYTQINGGVTPGAPLITVFNRVFVHIRDFELYNGSNAGLPGMGGGLCVTQECRVVVENCSIGWNTARNGGGVNAGFGAIIALSNCHVFGNTATAGGGGCYLQTATGVIANCTVESNAAQENGGGVSAGYSSLMLTGVVMWGNTADQGGGLYAWRSDVECAGPGTSIGDASAGHAPNAAGDGGGLAALQGTLTIRDWVHVVNNSAARSGGAVWITNGTLVARGNVLIGADAAGCSNYAGVNGGGICAIASTLALSNQAQVLQNTAGGAGGGVYGLDSRLTVRECFVGTLATGFANRATLGGGISAQNCSSVFTTVEIAGNSADQAGGLNAGGGGSCFINDSTIIGNRAQTFGGARLDALTLTAVCDQSDIISNSATVANGGISTATPLLMRNNARVMYNEAPETAGLGVLATTATLDTVEISYNQATNGGAGIDVFDGQVDGRDVLIQFNNADRDGDGSGAGGGVRADNGVVNLRADAQNALLFANSAGQGGGVQATWGSRVLIESVSNRQYLVTGNMASRAGGGGACAREGSLVRARGNVVFNGNNAPYGGAACATNGGTIELSSSNGVAPRAVNNIATCDGGALCGFGAGSTVRLERAVLGAPGLGNKAMRGVGTYGGGGGVAVFDHAVLDAVNPQIINNTSERFGGAVYGENAYVSLRGDGSAAGSGFWPGCVIAGNANTNTVSADGIVYVRGSAARLTLMNAILVSNLSSFCSGVTIADNARGVIVNAIITHNRSPQFGGPALFSSRTSDLSLAYCTIADNGEGGVYVNNGGTSSLTNCIVWGHTAYQFTFPTMADYCCVQGGFILGTHIITNYPQFINTNALNYQIAWGSSCINTGIMINVTNDCNGMIRPQRPAPDLGAYETVPEPGAALMLVGLVGLVGRVRHVRHVGRAGK